MKKILLIILLTIVYNNLFAQYFITGASSTKTRWSQLKSSDKRVIFPDYYLPKAKIVEGYLDTTRRVITNGLLPKIDYIPVLLFPEKAQANGLVTWTPRRMELYTTPSTESYSLPWLKQLSIHEYRHVVQLSNLNIGFTKAAGYVLGEQAVGIVTLVVPGWFFEGDATLAETQLAVWGRGKQPEFSINYRAIFNEDHGKWNYDLLKAGSMRAIYPSMYEMGYYAALAGQTFYNKDIWAEMMNYCGRYPYLILSPDIVLKRKYGVSSRGVLLRGFNELRQFWKDASAAENSSQFIPSDYRWYEKNEAPIMLSDDAVLTHRMSMDVPYSFVISDINNGVSKIVDNSVLLNSRQVVVGDKIYWTEYKPSLFWEQKSSSVMRRGTFSWEKGKPKITEREEMKSDDKQVYFITSLGDNRLSYIAYDHLNNPELVVVDNEFKVLSRTEFGGWDTSITSMDFDNKTELLYLVVVNNDGLSVQSFDPDKLQFAVIKEPSHVQQRHLRAKDGKLYFSSTASGKDEAHIYDIASGKEYQITSSKYGSFSPTPEFVHRGDTISVLTTYKRMGYGLATQKVKIDSTTEIAIKKMPTNTLNPNWHEWNLMKIDSINITPTTEDLTPTKQKRFRKLAHTFNPHSWLPFTINIDKLLSEKKFDVGVGATVMSQNLLGGLVTTVGYGYVPNENMSMLIATASYSGLPVHFDVSLNYGGSKQSYYFSHEIFTSEYSKPLKKFLDASVSASLPMNFSDGRRSRWLSPFISYSYENALLVDNGGGIATGLNKTSVGVQWQTYKYKAERDIESPLGYMVSANASMDPFSDNFGKLYSLYGTASLPGIFNHHAIVLKANVQYQSGGMYNYKQKTLYPQGCDFDYAPHNLYATSIAYKFPIAYPDGGIPNVIFFRRIAMGVFGEYAHNRYFTSQGLRSINPYTYGVEFMFDYNLLASTTRFFTSISLYKPSDKSKIKAGFSFGVTF